MASPVTNYKGSERTKALIEDQIRERWGESELKNHYSAYHSARTYNSWKKLGYKIIKGEKALKSYTFMSEDKEGKLQLRKYYRRPVFLWYYRQVEPINNTQNY